MAKETCVYGKRELYLPQKRPAYTAKETYCMAKETYYIRDLLNGKRDLHMQQKRRTYVAKETGEAACRGLVVERASVEVLAVCTAEL